MGLKTYWKVTENQGYLDDLKGSQLKEFFDCMAPTVVSVENKKGGSGSGVIIDEGRRIITCARVMEGDLEPTIIRASQKCGTKASISKYDRESDLCVLKYDQKNKEMLIMLKCILGMIQLKILDKRSTLFPCLQVSLTSSLVQKSLVTVPMVPLGSISAIKVSRCLWLVTYQLCRVALELRCLMQEGEFLG